MTIFPLYRGPALLEQICTPMNLTQAWRRVRSNIRVADRAHSAGVDAVTLRDFEQDLEAQLAELADQLRSGSYRAQPVRRVSLPKSDGSSRAIAVLTIRDRVAQRATQQVLQPLFDPLLLDCSFGCRPELGVADALAQVTALVDDGLSWAVDTDIADFFDTIDQARLLELLRQRVREPRLLDLIAQWLQSGGWRDGTATAEPQPLQQLWTDGRAQLQAWWQQMGEAGDDEAYPGGTGRSAVRMAQLLSMAQPAWVLARRLLPALRPLATPQLAIGGAVVGTALALGAFQRRRQQRRNVRGTPQGGALSPLLANIFLHPFDLALRRRGVRLVRYLDDMVALSASRARAERDLAIIREELSELSLSLNERKTAIVRSDEGLAFLGHVLLPEQPARLGGLTLPALPRRWKAQASVAAAATPRRRPKRAQPAGGRRRNTRSSRRVRA